MKVFAKNANHSSTLQSFWVNRSKRNNCCYRSFPKEANSPLSTLRYDVFMHSPSGICVLQNTPIF